ncbi:MAG: hypothetical protein PVI90_13120 [Desulfobacteraceae bacterium]|jgi:hypothetical protein
MMSNLKKKKKDQEIVHLTVNMVIGEHYMDTDHNNELKVREINHKKEQVCFDTFRQYSDENEPNWHPYGKRSFKEINRQLEKSQLVKLEKPLDECWKDLLQEAISFNTEEEKQEVEESQCTDLAISGDKAVLHETQTALKRQQDKVKLLQSVLDAKKRALWAFQHNLEEKLAYVNKVLYTIELYMGVYEDIIVIRDGEPAPLGTPVHIRQLMLYMDEEVADTKDQGIDFERIEEFDQWLIESSVNLDQVLPDKKGIVAIKVRRNKKYYGTHPITEAEFDRLNAQTYLLIRNGEKLYRIWTSLNFSPRMYPLRSELKALAGDTEGMHHWDIKTLEDKTFNYKQNIIVLQGLFDRTEVFAPMKTSRVVLMDETTWNDEVVCVADEEPALPNGRVPFNEWQKTINEKIQVGSRIVYGGRESYQCKIEEYVPYNYRHTCNGFPGEGVYVVSDDVVDHSWADFRFKFHDGATIWGKWTGYDREADHKRKHKIGFNFSKSCRSVLNYDQIELEDIDFYLTCRIDRPNYLTMMPLLRNLKKHRLEELKKEREFVSLVTREGYKEEDVWKAVDWWKYKNKWKRPITLDDKKAWRMIIRKLRNN